MLTHVIDNQTQSRVATSNPGKNALIEPIRFRFNLIIVNQQKNMTRRQGHPLANSPEALQFLLQYQHNIHIADGK